MTVGAARTIQEALDRQESPASASLFGACYWREGRTRIGLGKVVAEIHQVAVEVAG
jgi:hypothetical protein